MNRRITRGLLAAATACAAVVAMPSAAHANHIFSLCDNIDPGSGTVFDSGVIPTGLGPTIQVHIQLDEDSFVKVDFAGTENDILVGVDLGTVNLLDPFVVCVRLPIVGNRDVEVDPTGAGGYFVKVCHWENGEPTHGGTRVCEITI